MTIPTIKEVEAEFEARLQMIPHHLDRQKMRGIVQRLLTTRDKAWEYEKSEAYAQGYNTGAREQREVLTPKEDIKQND